VFLVVVHKIGRHGAKNGRIATPSSQKWPP
jgi:hypothetical protein